MESKKLEILQSAEKMVRQGGYSAFSFREIAADIGIKSSSVHYHFPAKADLGAAVAAYYTDNFMKSLGDPDDAFKRNNNPIAIYVTAFRNALTIDKRMCLCGMLGAEIANLPPEVAIHTKAFFQQNLDWLTEAYSLTNGGEGAKIKATQTLALLEGAMMMSNALNDINVFDAATKHLI